MNKLLLIAGVLLKSMGLLAQPTGAEPNDDTLPRYSVTQLQADLTFLRRAVEEVHPALYWYTPKDSLNHYFARTAAALTHPMNEQEYWPLLQALVVELHCGHTTLKHSAGYRTWFRKQPTYYFPFTVAIRQDRLFVVDNQSADSTLRTGTEIAAIEGHPAREVLTRMRALLAGDGYQTGFKDQQLEAGFFDEYYWALYEAKPAYQLLLQDSAGQQRQLTPLPKPAQSSGETAVAKVPLTPEQQRIRRLTRLRSIIYPDILPATAVLRISGFSYDELEDYKRFHAAVFAELAQRRTRHLIIDLRGNTGGNNEIGIDLLKYLLPKGFVLTKSALASVFAPSFMPVGKNSSAAFDTTQVKRMPDGHFAFAAATVGPQTAYRRHHFRGKVYVVVDGGTFSAASNFAASLRAQRKVVVLGAESGGAEAGTNGGVLSQVELPHTRMVLQLPHFKLLTACARPQLGRGVRPDVEVIPPPQQRAARTDAVLLKLAALLR
jgi:C-terminal processing protease CtpA/Prc